MSEIKNFIIKSAIPTALVLATAFSESGESHSQTVRYIEPAPKGVQNIQIQSSPSQTHFQDQYRVRNIPFDTPSNLVRDDKEKPVNREAQEFEVVPKDYTPFDVSVNGTNVRSLVLYSAHTHILDGNIEVDKNKLTLRKLITFPYIAYAFDTAKDNPQISVAGGEGGRFSLTQDGGKNWEHLELNIGNIFNEVITPDQKYTFLYPSNSNLKTGDDTKIIRINLKDKTTKEYTVFGIKHPRYFDVTTEFYYDKNTDSYTQFAGSSRDSDFYKITYYPDGTGIIRFDLENQSPEEITPFVTRTGESVVWIRDFKTANILEIKNNQITRIIAGDSTINPDFTSRITSQALDIENDVAYLGTRRTKYDPLTRQDVYSPHLEVVSLTDYTMKPFTLVEDDTWSKNGVISGLNHVREGNKSFLVINMWVTTSLQTGRSGLYIKDVTEGLNSTIPAEKATINSRVLLVVAEKPKT